jgi:hypothetical protein
MYYGRPSSLHPRATIHTWLSSSLPSAAPPAATQRCSPCRKRPASTFISANSAATGCGPGRGTVACFAATGMYPVHPSKRRSWVCNRGLPFIRIPPVSFAFESLNDTASARLLPSVGSNSSPLITPKGEGFKRNRCHAKSPTLRGWDFGCTGFNRTCSAEGSW